MVYLGCQSAMAEGKIEIAPGLASGGDEKVGPLRDPVCNLTGVRSDV